MELITDGAEVDVNASNVQLYVHKYAELRMVRCQEKALKVSQILYLFSALCLSVTIPSEKHAMPLTTIH